jgi:hypothetical protein
MNQQQNQLRSVLQALALPVTGQLRLYPSEVCKVSRLIQEFDQSEPIFLAQSGGSLTTAQNGVLISLRNDLRIACGEVDHTCNDIALRRNVAWQRVRLMARTALLLFDWPMVELSLS